MQDVSDSLESALSAKDERTTTLISRNITVMGRRTSIRLEPEMWSALCDIAKRERCSIHDLCSLVGYRKRQATSLTAAIRVFLMLYYKAASTDDGHRRAGHGSFARMASRARIKPNELSVVQKRKRSA